MAGIKCTDLAYPRCVDDPRDDCTPPKGADCPGICEKPCIDTVLCVAGTRFDPIKCGCVKSTIFVPRPLPLNNNIVKPTPNTNPQPNTNKPRTLTPLGR